MPKKKKSLRIEPDVFQSQNSDRWSLSKEIKHQQGHLAWNNEQNTRINENKNVNSSGSKQHATPTIGKAR